MSQNANGLLGFYFNPTKYEGSASRALDSGVVQKNIERISNAVSSMIDSSDVSARIDPGELLKQLKGHYLQKDIPSSVGLSRRESRMLSYSILPSWDIPFNKYCLDVLDINWSTSNLRGLMHSMMSGWNDYEPDARISVRQAINSHIDKDGSRYSRQLQPLRVFINEPYRLGRRLANDNRPITDCCQMFGLPDNRFNYSFFSDAIIAYYEQKTDVRLEDLKSVLKTHNNNVVDKTLIPRFIIQLYKQGRLKQDVAKGWTSLAIERIGDPSLESRWAPFRYASREVQRNLEEARVILMRLISSEFVNVFFNKLCYDPSRLDFWLKHTGEITNFMVYGTEYSLNYIRPYVNSSVLARHYYVVSTNTTNSALVMFIGKYVLIEFTEIGALYVYQKDSMEYKNVFKKGTISKLEDLKLPQLSNLIEIDGEFLHFNSKGKMKHSGYWQGRLEKWFARMT